MLKHRVAPRRIEHLSRNQLQHAHSLAVGMNAARDAPRCWYAANELMNPVVIRAADTFARNDDFYSESVVRFRSFGVRAHPCGCQARFSGPMHFRDSYDWLAVPEPHFVVFDKAAKGLEGATKIPVREPKDELAKDDPEKNALGRDTLERSESKRAEILLGAVVGA